METATVGRQIRAKRTSARPAERKPARKDGRVKSTLLLEESLDFRLSTIAASQKMDRSQLASQLIDAGLQRYALDKALRQFAGSTLTVTESAEA
jgi:predicted DNA-binding ribbon-helix-helix protein